MDNERLRAYLNLFAVLQNVEELVRLDPGSAALTARWDLSLEFSIWGGPSAHLVFKSGVCSHGMGHHPSPTIKLLCTSAKHLNAVFDNQGTPFPLRGLMRIGFLKNDFARLTARLTQVLRETPDATEAELALTTTLLLDTAAYAVRELALHESACQKVAAHMPFGTMNIEIGPDGPGAAITFSEGGISVRKAREENPMARMIFKDRRSAYEILTGKRDPFAAIGEGIVMLRGKLPMIDSVNLILDRVPRYLA